VLKPLKVLGLNSGTSLDGIDAALFLIEPDLQSSTPREVNNKTAKLKATLIKHSLVPFKPEFQGGLKAAIAQGKLDLDTLCRLNFALGEVFADAALQVIQQAGLKPEDVDLIGSHGQTIWHAPTPINTWGMPSTGTWQIGEPSVIAVKTGIPVVADFRVLDMALGGQGAPLVAFADEVLFGNRGECLAVLNIGGIANITALDSKGEARLAFDTGPGNMMIDQAAHRLFKLDFDESGEKARAGKVQEIWLSELLKHPYFDKKPPKTTGREVFGQSFADNLIDQGLAQGFSPEDVIATLSALTAKSIAKAYEQYIYPSLQIGKLVLGGGGAENRFLVEKLNEYWPHPVNICRHEDFGISTKFKEALLFALLAYAKYFGIPSNVPACTGATKRASLGKICKSEG
jgi:anhydro-N-acetylmuramic acid kinase